MGRFTARQNADGTITIAAGRYRETIDPRERTADEVADRVRWAAITAGIPAAPLAVEQLLADLSPTRRSTC